MHVCVTGVGFCFSVSDCQDCGRVMFKTSLVTWHHSPLPASRSSSLACGIEKLEGRMWVASLNSCNGLQWCSRGPLLPAAILILPHMENQHPPWSGWRHTPFLESKRTIYISSMMQSVHWLSHYLYWCHCQTSVLCASVIWKKKLSGHRL